MRGHDCAYVYSETSKRGFPSRLQGKDAKCLSFGPASVESWIAMAAMLKSRCHGETTVARFLSRADPGRPLVTGSAPVTSAIGRPAGNFHSRADTRKYDETDPIQCANQQSRLAGKRPSLPDRAAIFRWDHGEFFRSHRKPHGSKIENSPLCKQFVAINVHKPHRKRH